MFREYETYCVEVMRGRKGALAAGLRVPLGVLSAGYGLGSYIRNMAYNTGIFKVRHAPIPVISVGNIVAGGTGKTPVTAFLAEALLQDQRVGIVSRGYRSDAEKNTTPLVLPDDEVFRSAALYGDEAVLLKKRIPNAILVVGRDRLAGAIQAAERGANVVVLDDGMQHRRLHRDIDIAVVDGRDPFGGGRLLPAGFLRESKRALARAHFIVVTNTTTQHQRDQVISELSRYSDAPCIATEKIVDGVFDITQSPRPSLQGVRVGMYCSIARPEYFKETLTSLGAVVVRESLLPDHIAVSQKQIHAFATECRAAGAQAIVCTEKDMVRFCEDPKMVLPLWWVRMSLSVSEGKHYWNSLLEKVRGLCTNCCY